mmetsp:Transcript_52068/g.111452  ORF Transcript_52068/g.111452 Transcript_52068/m.111452 type:complete len:205 (+) Transcript_52068:489-1103(+)
MSLIDAMNALKKLIMMAMASSGIPQSIFQRLVKAISMIKVGAQITAIRVCHLRRPHPFEKSWNAATPRSEAAMLEQGNTNVAKNFDKLGPCGNWYLLSVTKYIMAPWRLKWRAFEMKKTKLTLAIMGFSSTVKKRMTTALTTIVTAALMPEAFPHTNGVKKTIAVPLNMRKVSPIGSFCLAKNVRIWAIVSFGSFPSPKPRNMV